MAFLKAKMDSVRNIDKAKFCNEKSAIMSFFSQMKFYYPTWKIKGTPQVISSDADCSYEISTLIKSTKYNGYGDFETLIVRIHFWENDNYQKFSFDVIKSPVLFDE